MSHLFETLNLRDITLRNRIGVSPMCLYSCKDGLADDWHLVHLGSRAIGGAGLVMMEASAISPTGRITDTDHGIWSDAHIEPLRRITTFIKAQGSIPAIQIAHAGRKASRTAPWLGDGPLDNSAAWQAVGPSPLRFAHDYQVPHELLPLEIEAIIADFAAAAQRAHEAGFQMLELHAAHGYLLHSFLSPLSNKRQDSYGGCFAHRCRIVIDTLSALRKVWPDNLPLALRISASDWVEGGWTLEDSIKLSILAKATGVDLIDCSSAGLLPNTKVPVGAHYQVPFADSIRRQAEIKTAAVGMITEGMQADAIIRTGQADLIFLGRELLRDPYWPLHAAIALKAELTNLVPQQYARAFPG